MRDISKLRRNLCSLLQTFQRWETDAFSDNKKAPYADYLQEHRHLSQKTAYRWLAKDIGELRVSELLDLCEAFEVVGL